MTSTATLPAASTSAPIDIVYAIRREPLDVIDAWRARWEAGTTNGLWPETDDQADVELVEDPAADRLDWDLR